MRQFAVLLIIAAFALVLGSHGISAAAANGQAKLPTMTTPDVPSYVRSLKSKSDGDSTHKLRGTENKSVQDEERGLFSNLKVKGLLGLGVNKFLSKGQQEAYYKAFLERMAARLVKKEKARSKA
ncbi:secreted RxLR effector peptide protein, putative [Phytophthora infestans T30-4]